MTVQIGYDMGGVKIYKNCDQKTRVPSLEKDLFPRCTQIG